MKRKIRNLFGTLIILAAAVMILGCPVNAADRQITVNEDCVFTLDRNAPNITIHNSYEFEDLFSYKVTYTRLGATDQYVSADFYIDHEGEYMGHSGSVDADSQVLTDIIEPYVLDGSDFIVDMRDVLWNSTRYSYVTMKIRMEPIFDIFYADTVLDKNSFTYDGKPKRPKIYVEFHGTELKEGIDYSITYHNNVSVGTGYIELTGKGSYGSHYYTKFYITKGANPLSVRAETIKLKYSKLKKKTQNVNLSKYIKSSGAQGAVTYTLKGVNKKGSKKYFKIDNKNGKLTVKKGLKKGTYKVKIAVTAAGDKNYNDATKTVTCKVKVK